MRTRLASSAAGIFVAGAISGPLACGSSGSPAGNADGGGSGIHFSAGVSFNPGGGSSTSGQTGVSFSVGSTTGTTSVVGTTSTVGTTNGTTVVSSQQHTSSSACVTNTGPITGTIGNNGGSISRLVFAVAGDCRPNTEDDTSGYPTAIAQTIFEDVEALSPHPPLMIGTGDYQFSEASNGTGAAQVQLFMNARKKFTGAYFPAMGNHECGVSGSFSTSDNNDCGPGNPGGATVNYNAFISEMMQPIGQNKPYYSVNVSATDNSWTAKFVIIAANAWDSGQSSWLTGVMAQATTYTFVVRHETSDATPPLPNGVPESDAILANAKYTMIIAGHDHTHGHYNDATGVHQEVIFGNGGAPITNGSDFGYGLFSQRCDGAIVVDAIDYMTGATDGYFHFVATPDGALTQ
jgi:hypothetical protein